MQENVVIVAHTNMMDRAQGKHFKHALEMFYSGDGWRKLGVFIFPEPDGRFCMLRGYGHIRMSVMDGIIKDFNLRTQIYDKPDVSFDDLYTKYSALPTTIHEKDKAFR